MRSFLGIAIATLVLAYVVTVGELDASSFGDEVSVLEQSSPPVADRLANGANSPLLQTAQAQPSSGVPNTAAPPAISASPAANGPNNAVTAQQPPTAAPTAKQQSDAEILLILIRTTIVALHQANISGNYTVLRDISAPGFRDKNSAVDLGRIFAPIREARIDLSQAVLLDPNIRQANLNNEKMLHVVGAFDTKPLPVAFELLFEPVSGTWRIFGISITPIGQVADVPKPQSAPAKPPLAKRKPTPSPAATPAPSSAAPGPKTP